MKKATFYYLLFILFFSGAWSLSAKELHGDSTMPETGIISLDSVSYNLGTLPADTIVEGEVHFRNTGKAPFQIFSIFSECGCTSTSYPTDLVEPGKEGVIRIRFNSKGRRPGPFRKALRIRSNALNERAVIMVKGNVE